MLVEIIGLKKINWSMSFFQGFESLADKVSY